MVTRLKNFSTRMTVKVIAFILAVAAFTASADVLMAANLKGIPMECIFVRDYGKSEAFLKEVKSAINEVDYLSYYEEELMETSDYYYYISYNNGEGTSSNTDMTIYDFQKLKYFFVLQDQVWKIGNTDKRIDTNSYANRKTLAYIAFRDKFIEDSQIEWDNNRKILMTYIEISAALAILGLLILAFLVCVTGRVPEDGKVRLLSIDKLFTEVIIIAFGFTIYFFISHLGDIFEDDSAMGFHIDKDRIRFCTDFQGNTILSYVFFSMIFITFTSVFMFFFLSLVRRAKARILIKNCIIYYTIRISCRSIKDLYQILRHREIYETAPLTKKLYYRQLILITTTIVIFLLAVLAAVINPLLLLIPAALETGLIYWYTAKNNQIYTEIENGLKESLQEQMKSERTKVALITNVSHDLKTPLTSIISYIDLLSRENGMSDTAVDYIKILQSKSERLKNIVTDLFDLAKSTSGDIPLEYSILDMKRLLEQTLAEMEDRISSSNLQIKTKLPELPVNIYTDGKKLYRVFQNIIDNALKYSQQGTRIYINLETDGRKACATVKNIAGYEMDFTAEEILQRFTRGDQARSEEGSGLGLSIAESFTKVCGGDLKVDIDGDMFKVLITFPIVKENKEEQSNPLTE